MAILVALTLCAATIQGGSERTPEGPPLRVSAQYVADGRLHRMTAANETRAEVHLNEVWLPWGSLYTTTLVAVFAADPVGRGRAMERILMEVNPVGSMVTIPPGGQIAGDIGLDQQFPDLKGVLARTDVILFWSYVPRYSPGALEGPRTGGWLLLPREGSAKPKIGRLDNKQMQRTRPAQAMEPRR
jgi:hypothetical protein